MAFPVSLTSQLTGASIGQLAHWRATGIVIPEIESAKAPYLYSFRDIVALRTFAFLRGRYSLQKIRKSLDSLREMDMAEHPGAYTLVGSGSTISVVDSDNGLVDLLEHPGQAVLGSYRDVFADFETVNERRVVPLLQPRKRIEVNPDRLGGWPTIIGTRVPYDVVAQLVEDGSVTPEHVADYYPGVTAAAARDALDFHRSVNPAA